MIKQLFCLQNLSLDTGIPSLVWHDQSSIYTFKCYIIDEDGKKVSVDSEHYIQSNEKENGA